ncbi:DNA-directed RNA polymerase subunit L [Candidatus Woesearchaeota archaeon]|nr:MAG: DNA-directed RNA polymerase subunit L [archaeon GW2011_AR4]MBS3130252.1 DNA-directed RNA polymerase subunit L [Candidatus Woesearchaeota archaeon]HIH38183.1 DNA-directed RNA polymerase subunit L [Candidatus Woesearchaeota archaeon]HIH49478.1 DNA-directed RNA polymerase subunit L [Candidatus Woesearchaeota archaeon]HIJ03860.1 DNA-directed RNA polymerase subunit L [Candidatus Woesearchaeota archaeon]
MKVIIVEEGKDRLVFQIEGETHTLCNALKEELTEDKDVKVATYRQEHPLVALPEFLVETSGKPPRKALEDAVKRLKSKIGKLSDSAKKGLK